MIAAVLFDVDGTLYHQDVLRALMAAELGSVPLFRERRDGPRLTWRVLRTFRHVREELRDADPSGPLLEDIQFGLTAERCTVGIEAVRRVVTEWIYERPLRYMAAVRRPGVRHALAGLRSQGLRVGVFSDYPTARKLQALGLDDLVSLQLSATDPDINAFKPHPRGFLAACERWGLPPDRVAYVGDRPDVDAAGATAAGMGCLIVGRRRRASGSATYTPLRSLASLPALLAHEQLARTASVASAKLD